ncbi:MAG: hypothetical protein JHC33_10365 [Ignisphaera sp.]|jgi:hypothetical protein|nr:hypothetical protein [Ignisphaera sp.]
MNKQDKLNKLDIAILDKMLEWIETDETNRLPELGNAISYLKANAVVEDKKQDDDILEQRKKKLAEVKKHREQV